MKTKTSLFFKGLIAAMLVVIFTGCAKSRPSADQVLTKIEANDSLSQADYSTIIDYCGDYARQAQKYYDIINAQPSDSTQEAITATNDLANLYADDKCLDKFRSTLGNASMSRLDKTNQEKVNEFAKYQGFPLPDGAGQNLENPDVVGMIQQTPSSDTTGVISQGDGEAVDVNVAD